MSGTPHGGAGASKKDKAHPFIALLRDRDVRVLWGGLAFSAVGDELYRVGVIWLAVGLAGADAALLPAAQYAAVLVASLAAGAFADLLRPRTAMIVADLARAVLAVVPVLATAAWGLSLPTLIASSVALAAFGALFSPALLSAVPRLVPDPGCLLAVNGLMDATARLARLAGPFLAGAMATILPTLHLLTANAASFLISATAVATLGNRFDVLHGKTAATTVWRRMGQGVAAARSTPGVPTLLLANAAILAAWILGLTIGVPLLVAARVSMVGGGLGVLALVMGAYGVGDFTSNVLVATHAPERPWRFMFAGYVVLGSGLGLLAAAFIAMPEGWQVPVAMVLAFVSGLGGPMFFLPMMTRLQAQFSGADLAGVIRLRVTLTSAAMMIGATLGPPLFHALGTAATVGACGTLIAAVGLAGAFSGDPLRIAPRLA